MLETQAGYDVGGVRLERPFKIRRLGHFGLNVTKIDECIRFYTEDLGFRISDCNDMGKRVEDKALLATLGDPRGFFMRHATDHHSFVVFNRRVREAAAPSKNKDVVINQMSWQVGSLAEVMEGDTWLKEDGAPIQRTGRDMPGSNWHTYFYDPDGHVNELFYGMEQIGWDSHSKPLSMWDRAMREAPQLPSIPESEEIVEAAKRGDDLTSGSAFGDALSDAKYDVEGVMLPRPFKVIKVGPVGLFVADVEAATEFYKHYLGLRVTEETMWDGERCVFLRANTEHHTLALYPLSLRKKLGQRADSTTFTAGFQVGSYRQLVNARDFLVSRGAKVSEIPPQLHPGIDYAIHVLDPDGQAVQLYFSMEQIGWDGKPRPAASRPNLAFSEWPQTVPETPDVYGGETLFGPLG